MLRTGHDMSGPLVFLCKTPPYASDPITEIALQTTPRSLGRGFLLHLLQHILRLTTLILLKGFLLLLTELCQIGQIRWSNSFKVRRVFFGVLTLGQVPKYS